MIVFAWQDFLFLPVAVTNRHKERDYTMESIPLAQQHYDLSGLRCPHLLIEVIRLLRDVAVGTVVRISADDLSAPSSIGAWTRQSGNKMLDIFEDTQTFTFIIRCDCPPAPLKIFAKPENNTRKMNAERPYY